MLSTALPNKNQIKNLKFYSQIMYQHFSKIKSFHIYIQIASDNLFQQIFVGYVYVQ